MNLRLNGKNSDSPYLDKVDLFEEGPIQPKETIVLGTALRGENTEQEIKCSGDDDIIALEFEDGGEWIGSAKDFMEIFGTDVKTKAQKEGHFTIPSTLSSNNNTRGIGDIAILLFKRYILPSQKTTKNIGVLFDERLMPAKQIGLFHLDSEFKRKPVVTKKLKAEKYLLFLHGTISSTDGSFSKIRMDQNSNVWDTILQKYKKNILCLEHKTVSVSPIQNAVAVLEKLPEGCSLDIISHSRGGIIADLLARCDPRNESGIGFSEEDIKRIEDEDKDLAKLLVKLNDLAAKKKIEVHKTIRVACPARGTVLLENRLDHFLNGLLYALGLMGGGDFSNIYQHIRTFIMEVIKTKKTAISFPGLNSMRPDSTFQKILNNPLVKVKNELLVIEGDAELGPTFLQSVGVILINLYTMRANDLVVNTDSMRYGVIRESGVHFYLSKDRQTNHFSYFKNENTQTAIRNALEWEGSGTPGQFKHLPNVLSNRGIVLDFVKYGEVKIEKISGQRPIVILLPGIMGSNLEVDGDKIWVDLKSVYDGKIKTHLHIGGNVKAKSIVGQYYSELVKDLKSNGYDVRIFPYDWRLSLTAAGEELCDLIEDYSERYKQPIKIIAHSMGGLVVREVMQAKPEIWKKYIEKEGARFIMLGTPWKGSYSILEVLTGAASLVKKLAFLDWRHSKEELLEVFKTYEGIFELLPIDDNSIEDPAYWSGIANQLFIFNQFVPPSNNQLAKFAAYKKRTKAFFDSNINFDNIYYVAGYKNFTVDDYRINESFFGNSLQFVGTSEGDGSVSYKLGIPDDLPSKQVFYTHTEHGKLASDSNLFGGIKDLLKEGTTNRFRLTPPSAASRGFGQQILIAPTRKTEHNDFLDTVFGVDSIEEKTERPAGEITVSLSHAHLREANYPVMVGHFEHDGIISAEGALNKALDDKLEERRRLGNYANQIGEQFVLCDYGNEPKGAVVVGLGDPTKLTSYKLMKTVEMGVIEYALHMRDDKSNGKPKDLASGISSLTIGSSFGKIPLESALKAILNGVNNANRKIEESKDSELVPIRKIEFVEIVKHIARDIFYALKRISQQKNKLNLRVPDKMEKKGGAKRRIQYNDDKDWWHQFMTRKLEEDGVSKLQFLSSSGIARVEEQCNYTSEEVVMALLKKMSKDAQWDSRIAKTLFELLIPNDFKQIIRNQHNILWKMDLHTAAFPWEMFHDSDYDTEPTFINAGLIRQITLEHFKQNPDMIRTPTALVIGDPIYGDFYNLKPLPAAEEEANWVAEYLEKKEYKMVEGPMIRKSGTENLVALSTNKFKILHIAAHGLYGTGIGGAGIVLGENTLLTPDMIRGIFDSGVPEFVFINCCYSGTIDVEHEKLSQNRYGFAANVGTQLIQMGVSAAVITGWPVNDNAAFLFAETFYKQMLNGSYFGQAVQLARNKCYSTYQKTNTWGAYQCYGNPNYRLETKKWKGGYRKSFISIEEVVCELENLLVDTQRLKAKKREKLIKKTKKIIASLGKDLYPKAEILEQEALIYLELNEPDLAIEKFEQLFTINKAAFSLRSFEQYCNLLAKKMLRDKVADTKKIDELITRFEAMLQVGKTPERLSLFGSAYKRFASLMDDSPKKSIEYLEKMASKYKEAFYLHINAKPAVFTYPLTNWLAAYYFLNKKPRPEPIIPFAGKPLKVSKFLVEVKKHLLLNKSEAQEEIFWEGIAIINISMCQLFFPVRGQSMESLIAEIEKQYESTFQLKTSLHKLQSEMEHIDCILSINEMVKKEDKAKKTKKEKEASLEKMKLVVEKAFIGFKKVLEGMKE